MRRLVLAGVVAASAYASAPFPPTLHLVGMLPDTMDLSSWYLSRPWVVTSCTPGIDASVLDDLLVVAAEEPGGGIGMVHLASPDGETLVIPLERRPLTEVSFSYDPPGDAPVAAFLAGSFNGWNGTATPMALRNDGRFGTTLQLPPGTYLYKFVVDGAWMPDPGNSDRVDDGLGSHNSVLHISSGLSSCRFVKSSCRDGRMTFVYYPPQAPPPSTIIVLMDGHEAPFTYESGAVGVEEGDGSFLRVLGADAEGRPLPESWTWLDRGIPRGREGADDGIYRSFIYSLFPDRFRNGDTLNDRPVCHPGVHTMVNYQGGDLEGIRRTLEEGYFDSLGVTTLWLGPLYPGPDRIAISPLEYTDRMRALSVPELDSLLATMIDPYFGQRQLPIPEAAFPPALAYSGYHGYWPVRDRDIEPRFGTVALMQNLVTSAHQRGFRVILDLVPHHVHIDHPWVASHPEWMQDLVLPDGTLNLRHWDAHRLTTWFDPFLPTLDLRGGAPGVDSVVASAAWWLETFRLDGFRHDATKHIPHEFWRSLTAGLRAAAPGRQVLQIGETFGSRKLVGSYAVPAEMDGQFDFNLYYASRPMFCGKEAASFKQVTRELEQSLDAFGPLHLMANVTGSHDQVRFITLSQQDIPPGANERQWGWTHSLTARDPAANRRLQLFFLFNLSVPGIPVLYYGDEIGMAGAADPDNRRMMRFGNELSDIERNHLAEMRDLGQLRRRIPALSYGDCVVLHVEEQALVIARVDFDQLAIVAFNLGSDSWERTVDLAGLPGSRLVRRWGEATANQYAGTVRLTMPPLSAIVLSTE
ncbi:MAG: alpha-amylase family glycosyl hydrolase [Candidatus Eisenbacteria bacterium]|nr:alpha-amylase family glycosyl hydrolase [Candidatus Eisenbacteria bacterium]